MKNHETGEFELVVGNRQLLSAFFIVVLLFAVAFAMGYVVGQNSPRPQRMASEGGGATGANPGRDARPQASMPSTPPVATANPPSPSEASPQPSTQPAQGSPPEPASGRAAAPAAPGGVIPIEDLPSGSFWQVMAVTQPQAEALRQTLTDHGFAVVLTPATKGLTRVLVGPYADTQSMGKAKTDLENVGMRPLRFKRD